MSDMNTPEVPADVSVEPTAAPVLLPDGDAAAVVAGEPEAPAEPVAAPEPTAAPEAVPVLARTPSSENETQQPEATPEVDEEPLPLGDAVRVLLVYVKAHRTAGDADLEAAVADVEASLAAQS